MIAVNDGLGDFYRGIFGTVFSDNVRLVLGNNLHALHLLLVGAHDFAGIELGVHRGDFVGLDVDLFLIFLAPLEQHFLFVLETRVLVVFLKLDFLGAFLKFMFLARDYFLEGFLLLIQYFNIRLMVDHLFLIRLYALDIALVGRSVFLLAPDVFRFLAPNAIGLILVQPMQFVIKISEAILVVEVSRFLGADGVAHQILVVLVFLFELLKRGMVFLELGGVGLFDFIDFPVELCQPLARALECGLVRLKLLAGHQLLAGTGLLQLNLSVLHSRLGLNA